MYHAPWKICRGIVTDSNYGSYNNIMIYVIPLVSRMYIGDTITKLNYSTANMYLMARIYLSKSRSKIKFINVLQPDL
jgi:hypothetical protein